MMAATRADRRPVDRDLTVVIPTLGRDILRQPLEALERGTVWPAQVVVVDQGQRGEIAALLDEVRARSFDTVWMPSSQRGRAAGVNRGIERAATAFVVVTDDDCLPQADWVEQVGARVRQHRDAIVTGRVEAGDAETVLFVMTERASDIQRRPRVRFDRLIGANMAVARAVVERLGGLDEDSCVRTAEDGEFAYRALRAGVSIVYAPEMVVTHLGWRDERQRADQYRSYARSQGGFYGKYLRRGDWFIALRASLHLARAARRWVLGWLRRDRETAAIGRAYLLGLLPGIRAGWKSGAA
jgi:GT2 family glycosyltransferase